MAWGYDRFPKYVPVAQRRANARRQMDTLRKTGESIHPVSIEGRAIARSFWGKRWCEHLEAFSDFSNRLPRGRTYVRNGSVCHLAIKPGRLEAMVSGSELYHVNIRISQLNSQAWDAIKRRCAGQVGSMLELLQGKLSDQVMAVVSDRKNGLFPQPGEIKLDCSCPDWAEMCKHVAAVLYGVGSRLDEQPELLFTLRGINPQELIATELALPDTGEAASNTLADDQLSAIFDIELDHPAPPPIPGVVASAIHDQSPRTRRHKNIKPRTTQPHGGQKVRAANHGNITEVIKRAPNIRPTGKSVARVRRQLGLSAAAFARQLGVAAATVHRWESTVGRLRLKPRSLEALAALQHKAAHLSRRQSRR